MDWRGRKTEDKKASSASWRGLDAATRLSSLYSADEENRFQPETIEVEPPNKKTGTLSKVKSFLQKYPSPATYAKKKFLPTNDEFLKMSPLEQAMTWQSAKQTPKTLKDMGAAILRQVPQGITRTALEADKLIAPDLAPKEYAATSKLGKFVLGKEPVKGFSGYGEDTTQLAESLGIKNASKNKAVNTAVGVGMTALDLLPLGLGKKQIAESLAKTSTEKGVLKLLGKESKNLSPETIQSLVKEKNVSQIENLLSGTKKTAKEDLGFSTRTIVEKKTAPVVEAPVVRETPKPTVKTVETPKVAEAPKPVVPLEIESHIKSITGKSFEKASGSEMAKAMIETKVPIADTGELVSKIGNANKGFAWERTQEQPALLGTVSKGELTDSYVLIKDKKIVDEIYQARAEKNAKKIAKTVASAEIPYETAYKEALKTELDIPKNMADKAPKTEAIIPKEISNQVAQVQGHFVNSHGAISTVLSDGKDQVAVATDRLAFVRKYFPDAELRMTDEIHPVQIVQDGEIKALLMPLTTGGEKIPFDAKNIVKGTTAPLPVQKVKEAVKVSVAEPKIAASATEFFGEKRPPFVRVKPKTAITKEGDINVDKKLVSKKEIIDDIRKALDTTILPTKKQKIRGALGYFKVKSEVIRINNTDDVEVAVHEVAHLMEKRIAGGVKANGGLSGSIVPPQFRKEVSALASKPGKGGSVYSEGFAEFMRVYATDREFAKKLAPDFFKYVEETLLKENQAFKAVLDNITEKWSTFMKQNSIERGLSQISFDAANVSPTIRQRWNNFYKKNVDALDPFRLLDKRFEALGLEGSNIYRKLRLMAGSTGKADSFLFNKTFNYVDGKLVYTGEGLHAISDPIKTDKDRKIFSLYMANRRTIADPKRKTGISISDARQGIEDIEKRYPHFKEMAQKVYDYSNRLLDYAYSSELITGELKYKLQQSGLDYIPLYRVQEDTRKFFGAGKKLADIVSPIKKRKGSGDIIIDPMENLVKNTYAILEASEKNKIWVQLGKIADTLDGVGGDLENIKAGKSAVAKVDLAGELRKKLGIPEELMPPELDELFNMLGGDAVNIFRPSMFKPEDSVVTYFRKGKPQNMRVSSDLYEAAMSLDESQMRFAGDWLLKLPAKVLRSGAILNPDFMAKNPIRDSFTSLIFAKKGYIIDSLYYSIRGAKSSITKDDDFWKWVVSGGSYVSPASYDRATLQKNAREVALGRGFKDIVKSPLEALRRLSEMGEAANRMGEFKRLTKGSMDVAKLEEGAFAAREVTVDFQRIGTRTKSLNSMAAFWNVGIQSTDRLIREFRNNPVSFIAKGTLGLTVPSVLLWTINKDNPEYQRKSSYEKDAFWLIPYDDGKRFFRIPKPFELGMIFASLPERMLDAAYKEDPKAMEQWAANFVSQLPGVPIPTAAVPIVENYTNFSFFKHRPLESQSMKNLAPSERSTAYTPELYKYLGKKLNLSPVKIQNIVEGYTAGLGKTVEQGISVLIKSDSASKDLSEYPILRTFLSRPSSGSGSSKVQDLYDKSSEVTEFTNTFNRMVKDGRAKEAQSYYDKHPEMKKFLRMTDSKTLGSILTARTDAISKLNLARIKIFMSSTMSEEEKKKATKKINEQIDKIAEEISLK